MTSPTLYLIRKLLEARISLCEDNRYRAKLGNNRDLEVTYDAQVTEAKLALREVEELKNE